MTARGWRVKDEPIFTTVRLSCGDELV